MELKGKIKEIRLKRGLSQKDMAKEMEVALSTYQYYERGEREAPSEFTIKLMKRFDVNPFWLFTGIGEMMFTPMAPAIDIALRIIKALYLKEYESKLKLFSREVALSSQLLKLGEDIGLMPGFVSLNYVMNPESSFPCEIIDRFCFKRGISLDWLYTGKGKMFLSEKTKYIDLDVLIEVKKAIRKGFRKENRRLSIRKEAVIEGILYDEVIEDPTRRIKLDERISKIAKVLS
jgi:transcriptional regulator with XRE-family HTH domain